MNDQPGISVIVPFHNAAATLEACLDAILRAAPVRPLEVIAVDDGSDDPSADICKNRGVQVLRMETRSGPAAARNRGAAVARGDYLYFLDADVIMEPENPAKLLRCFERDPDLAAVFGSYDTSPAAPNFLSQYRNLLHHAVHQKANPDARTFWAGCGAVRRDLFLEQGGFDADRYPEPSIEDIELGLRLHRRGHPIRLEKNLFVTHLKTWRFCSMLRTDILRRAWPWSLLILERGNEVNDLNLGAADRASGGLVCLAAALLPLALFDPRTAAIAAAALCGVLVLNRKLYRFFARERGLFFLLRVIPMHLLYFLTGSLAYAAAAVWVHVFRRKRPLGGDSHVY